MRRRNFIKIFAGTVAGLTVGVGLAKKEGSIATVSYGNWEGMIIVDDLKLKLALIEAKKYLEKHSVKALPSGKYALVVPGSDYEMFYNINDKYNLGYVILKERPTDRNFITIPSLSKKARGFK